MEKPGGCQMYSFRFRAGTDRVLSPADRNQAVSW